MTSGDMMLEEPGLAELQDPTFLMYSYKVKPCQKKYRHDWRVCPFAHEGESAARRDPRKFKYVGVACPYAKQGKSCPRGQNCPCTHNVFEYWLHPTRFRTEICSQGPKCNRSCCFFAHTDSELRKLKHQDIINSAVGDPNETCSALESYLRQTNTCELNDIENESDSHDSGHDAVIIMGSVPKVEDDESSLEEEEGVIVGMHPEADTLMSMPVHTSSGYSQSDAVLQSSRAYLTSPEIMLAQSPEGLMMDHQMQARYRMVSPQQDLPAHHLSATDIYMASPESGVLLGPDGQSHLVDVGAGKHQVHDPTSDFFTAYSRAAETSSPYGGHLPVSHQGTGLQQSGQFINMQSPTPSASMIDHGMGGRLSTDLTAVKSDYDILSRSWRMNRGVSFPAALNRVNDFGSAANLKSSAHHLTTPVHQPTSGAPIDDDLGLESEFQKLSASWGVNRGATLPALRQGPAEHDASFLLQKEHEQLSGSWGITRGASNPVHLTSGLHFLSGLDGIQTSGVESMRHIDGYQSDQNVENLTALHCNPQMEGFQRQIPPLPGNHTSAAIPGDFSRMTSSWGLGKNISSLSDSFPLGGHESYGTHEVPGSRTMGNGPPPGFSTDYSGSNLSESTLLSNLSFLGADSMGSFLPPGKVVGRNWTFGGNGRVA